MAAVLVTLDQAKAHLKIVLPALDPDEAEIQLKLDHAEASILAYLATAADPAWVSPETVPGPVAASILLQLGDLFENRGDDTTQEQSIQTWQQIERLLVQLRKVALA
jgi:hypothetical protein